MPHIAKQLRLHPSERTFDIYTHLWVCVIDLKAVGLWLDSMEHRKVAQLLAGIHAHLRKHADSFGCQTVVQSPHEFCCVLGLLPTWSPPPHKPFGSQMASFANTVSSVLAAVQEQFNLDDLPASLAFCCGSGVAGIIGTAAANFTIWGPAYNEARQQAQASAAGVTQCPTVQSCSEDSPPQSPFLATIPLTIALADLTRSARSKHTEEVSSTTVAESRTPSQGRCSPAHSPSLSVSQSPRLIPPLDLLLSPRQSQTRSPTPPLPRTQSCVYPAKKFGLQPSGAELDNGVDGLDASIFPALSLASPTLNHEPFTLSHIEVVPNDGFSMPFSSSHSIHEGGPNLYTTTDIKSHSAASLEAHHNCPITTDITSHSAVSLDKSRSATPTKAQHSPSKGSIITDTNSRRALSLSDRSITTASSFSSAMNLDRTVSPTKTHHSRRSSHYLATDSHSAMSLDRTVSPTKTHHSRCSSHYLITDSHSAMSVDRTVSPNKTHHSRRSSHSAVSLEKFSPVTPTPGSNDTQPGPPGRSVNFASPQQSQMMMAQTIIIPTMGLHPPPSGASGTAPEYGVPASLWPHLSRAERKAFSAAQAPSCPYSIPRPLPNATLSPGPCLHPIYPFW